MRQLSASEMVSLATTLEMENNALAMAKAGRTAVSDDELKSLVDSGITLIEARIKGFQQFIAENNVIQEGEIR